MPLESKESHLYNRIQMKNEFFNLFDEEEKKMIGRYRLVIRPVEFIEKVDTEFSEINVTYVCPYCGDEHHATYVEKEKGESVLYCANNNLKPIALIGWDTLIGCKFEVLYAQDKENLDLPSKI